MKLKLNALTNVKDLIIEYIEIRLVTDEIISFNWDESDISRNENGFSARYKGVYFNELYANGRINELFGMKIAEVGVYTESEDKGITITEMLFEDGDNALLFSAPINTRKGKSI